MISIFIFVIFMRKLKNLKIHYLFKKFRINKISKDIMNNQKQVLRIQIQNQKVSIVLRIYHQLVGNKINHLNKLSEIPSQINKNKLSMIVIQ